MRTALAVLALGIALVPLAASVASAHGCHREPAFDRRGFHRHVGPYCERVDLPPPRSERYRDDDDYRPYRRGPDCVKKCHYVGPFKTCDTICR